MALVPVVNVVGILSWMIEMFSVEMWKLGLASPFDLSFGFFTRLHVQLSQVYTLDCD